MSILSPSVAVRGDSETTGSHVHSWWVTYWFFKHFSQSVQLQEMSPWLAKNNASTANVTAAAKSTNKKTKATDANVSRSSRICLLDIFISF